MSHLTPIIIESIHILQYVRPCVLVLVMLQYVLAPSNNYQYIPAIWWLVNRSRNKINNLKTHNHKVFFVVFEIITYPPGRKCEALPLGVHLILLYFIRISSWWRRLFFYFDGRWWMVVGWWMPTFWFFKSLDINMVYSLGIYLDI